MKAKRFFWCLSIIFSVVLLALPQTWAQPRPGTKAPIITHAYAIEKGRYGNVLKIYIEADDPDGDMLRIATVAEQVGYGRYFTDWVYLKSHYQGHFVGYLQWNTFSSKTGGVREWTQVYLKVSVFDKAGKESNVVVFPYQFVSEVIRNPQPPAPFSQGNIPRLGYVDINLFGGVGRSK